MLSTEKRGLTSGEVALLIAASVGMYIVAIWMFDRGVMEQFDRICAALVVTMWPVILAKDLSGWAIHSKWTKRQ